MTPSATAPTVGATPARSILDAAYPLAGRDVLRRAASALDLALERVAASRWEAVAWSFSTLTGTGFPVELSFASERDEVRYTTEVAGPEATPDERLERALEVLAALRAELPADGVAVAGTLQSLGELRYGCWLGGRHGRDGDAYKLYVEVPKGTRVPVAAGARPDARLVPRMVAFDAATKSVEVYYRPWRIENLADAPLPPPLGELLQRAGALVAAIARRPRDRVLRGPNWGCSIATSDSGDPRAATLFTFARRLLGDDAAIRSRLLQVAATKGWTLPHYEHATTHLQTRRAPPTWHGLVGTGASTDGTVHLGIGVAARRG